MAQTSLYEGSIQRTATERINALTAESRPEWGKMDVAQMCAHCTETFEVMNGEKPLSKTPFIARLFKGSILKSLTNDKPISKNSPTHPQYKKVDQMQLDREKERLVAVIDRFVKEDEAQANARVHPFFGEMTADQRGIGMYKHLDHHLKQFGV